MEESRTKLTIKFIITFAINLIFAKVTGLLSYYLFMHGEQGPPFYIITYLVSIVLYIFAILTLARYLYRVFQTTKAKENDAKNIVVNSPNTITGGEVISSVKKDTIQTGKLIGSTLVVLVIFMVIGVIMFFFGVLLSGWGESPGILGI